MKDLGYANGWPVLNGRRQVPEIVKQCWHDGHETVHTKIANYLTETTCEKCGYKYIVDSSG